MYEVVVDTSGFSMWSMKNETHLLGLLQQFTIGLILYSVQ